MHVPVYIMCAALIAAVNGEENGYFSGLQNQRLNERPDQLNVEPDALGYLFPRLAARYRTDRPWNTALALPPYYALDIDNNLDQEMDYSPEERIKRAGLIDRPSLSISNSLDVLRNRLLLEISRKKTQQGMFRNRDFLCKIGKRDMYDAKRKCETEKYVDDKLTK